MYLFILSAVFLVSCKNVGNHISSSLTIYGSDESYFVMDNISDKTVKKAKSFNDAFDLAVKHLNNRGGKILIRAGIHEVASPLKLINRLEVEGEGIATALYVSDHFVESSTVFIADTLDDVSVRNLSIKQLNDKSAMTGIVYNHCGTSKIIDVIVLGLTGNGICLKNSSFLCEIRGCTLGKIKNSAVLLQNLSKGRAGDWVPNLISNCTVYSSGMGIELDSSIVVNVLDCQVFQTRSHAYFLHSQSNSVLVSGCRSYQIQDVAIKVISSHRSEERRVGKECTG